MANQLMSGNNGIFQAKFNGTGFSQWSFGVLLLARAKRLESIIQGTETRPTEIRNEDVFENQAEIDAWIEKDAFASGLIYSSLETSYQTSVGGSADAAEMWQRLNQEYAQVAAANTGQLTARFFQYQMDPDHSVSTHINKYRQMSDELQNVGAPVTYIQMEERILSTLPPSYHAVVAAWETQPRDENRNILTLTARLILEETRIKGRDGGFSNPADVAFFASHPSRQKKSVTYENQIDKAYAAGGGRGGYQGRGGQRGGRYRVAGSHRGGYNYRGHRGGPGNYSGSQTRNRGYHNDGRGYNHGSRPTFGSYDCYECGDPGHLARNCRNRRHAEEKKARQGKQDSYRNFNDGGYDNDQRDPTFNCLSSVPSGVF